LAAWRKQGLPEDVDLADYFDFDLSFMYLDTSPHFEQRILKRRNGWITYEDRFGYTVRKRDGLSGTLDYLAFHTANPAAWEEAKNGFFLDLANNAPARIDDASYFAHFDAYPTWAEALKKYQEKRAGKRYLLFMCYGPWEATWRHRGMEVLLEDVLLNPDWVREMADTYQNLMIATLEKCLSLGMRPDGVFIAEDLGHATGPLLGPSVWKTLFQPAMARLGAFLHGEGIDFWLHSDGAIESLIDDLIDCGVGVLNPLEVKAGMDAVALRKRYGKNLAFFGNMEAAKMGGDPGVLRQELERKIPLARHGGYIMHSDHSCPPNVDFKRYAWILKQARQIFAGNA
jgi:uroporphyrinogen decarboxylase